ncbi:hypothetical protein BT63DRAFT_474285 [Microthyrium microscopicum]|uniref:DUF7909 domain-containing protein n=1 Tax=Microthyrium microscopicum TaxID=703497 RepID=A0A6A6US09_9PEZI|nr:hypothetical protein BT63DRAFT_474285 [Microthyrium microscopicum]
MSPLLSAFCLALLGIVASTSACQFPDTPLSSNITDGFSIYVQNASIPVIHNRVLNFRPNGLDMHLVLRPAGEPTNDTLYLQNGRVIYNTLHAVIDLEYDPDNSTTKIFMTDRTYHPVGIFQPVYGCNPETDALQIELEVATRLTDPPVNGGKVGIRRVVDTYEFRYSPPDNSLLTPEWLSVTLVLFRNG